MSGASASGEWLSWTEWGEYAANFGEDASDGSEGPLKQPATGEELGGLGLRKRLKISLLSCK